MNKLLVSPPRFNGSVLLLFDDPGAAREHGV